MAAEPPAPLLFPGLENVGGKTPECGPKEKKDGLC